VTLAEAEEKLASADAGNVRAIGGSFALVTRRGDSVFLARSLDRPLRYFLAKEPQGPMLVVAESMREIADFLAGEGYGHQFHPSYTRMVPAHHVTTIRLVGCPDPSPTYERFLVPASEPMGKDLDAIGRRYVGALRQQLAKWLASVPAAEPIGVLFSGGIDSGSVFLSVYRELLERGESPARLKAFTLSVEGGEDLGQAREFLRRLDLEMFLEPVEARAGDLDPLAAIEAIEDYKPLDVECAAVNLTLLQGIRERYPEWRFLIDGDGGDENLKDYPIEENEELTIRSVVNNPLLYQEGWGVGTLKHSLTYSGGMSRGCVRTSVPARLLGFVGFSPYTAAAVVEVASAIPFGALAQGDHERLYGLKGEIVSRGVRQVLGFEMPVFPKRRFQHGATSASAFRSRLGGEQKAYRSHFLGLYSTSGV
ncbi:MAG: asparagine synthase-related protein, partial [Acidobacteriota bacterium]|nr:asparagine synthase-related protein [Acidobacteriota bacterium]